MCCKSDKKDPGSSFDVSYDTKQTYKQLQMQPPWQSTVYKRY